MYVDTCKPIRNRIGPIQRPRITRINNRKGCLAHVVTLYEVLNSTPSDVFHVIMQRYLHHLIDNILRAKHILSSQRFSDHRYKNNVKSVFDSVMTEIQKTKPYSFFVQGTALIWKLT
jgi:hypothetical protein